jgi:zinc protease
MKRIFTFIPTVLFAFIIQAQIDRTQQPQPGPAPEIQLEEPQEFQLDNGLTVLLVENHKLPKVSLSLTIDHPLILEGEKVGANSLLRSMMGKGSTSISKNDFEEEVDFMGANLYFTSNGARANSLSKYFPRVLELMADATLHPNFEEVEFQKEKEKLITALETGEKDVATAARRVENLLSYGSKHPYGEYVSKENVATLMIKDIQNAYDYIFSSKNAYLVVVGDFNPKETKELIQKQFGSWKPKDRSKMDFLEPSNVMKTEIAFVEMPNAVQSEITFINTASLTKNNNDYFAALLANQILGGGGEARLFLNLREDKGFTYGAYSRLRDSHKTKARFTASTSVRNAVTDSAVVEILHEVDKIRNELVTEEELELVKAKYAGSFVISLEDPETVADFALNIKTQNLPKNFYKDFLKNINKVSKKDILSSAKNYFLSDNGIVVVTGKGSDILERLEQIEFKGTPLKVRYFDKWGVEIDRPDYSSSIPEGVTASTVIEQYLEAIGGKSKLAAIKSIKELSTAEVQGMALEVLSQKTNEKQALTEMKMMGNVMQKQVVNKDYAYMEMQGQKMDMEGEVLNQMIEGAAIFPELELDPNTADLVGVTEIDGVKAYEVKISEGTTHFYSIESHLKIQVSQTTEIMGNTQTSIIKLSDYKPLDGILFPHKTTMALGPQKVDFIVQNIELNVAIDAEIFN